MKEENGPLIALVVFIVLSLVFGFMAYQRHQEVIGENPEQPLIEGKIKAKQEEIEKNQKKIKEARAETASYFAKIREQNARYSLASDEQADFLSEINRRKGLKAIGEANAAQATAQGNEISDKINTRLRDIKQDRDKEENDASAQVDKLNAKREDAVTKIRTLKEQLATASNAHRNTKDYAQAELDESKSVLSDLTQRDPERATVLWEADGEILVADPVTHKVFINLGTAAGVKNGYRFECFTIRPGQKKVRKAFVEVVAAGVSKSECIVVRRPVDLPRDPLSGYVAEDPEEMYSPNQERREAGRNTSSVQPLSAAPKTVLSGPSQLDPIVEGDKIQNPFFKPNKSFTFYIAGAKKLDNERQKSAIRYRWTEIKAVIEQYGGKVSPVADTTVDYMIAQKNPGTEGSEDEKLEFKKAVDLGLPVIYEWELFRFLDNK
jgi:hypothetical protein